MRALFAAFTTVGLMVASVSAMASVHPHHHTSAQAIMRHSSVSHSHHAEHTPAASFGSSIGSERATEIQSALIKNGYLSGSPTGTWDSTSIAAMQKLQSDNGWQTKLIPDSRALIKLGLGPTSTPASATQSTFANLDAPSPY